jgi:hypothetical protein
MKEGSFNREGGGWDRRRKGPSLEKEEVGIDEGGVLQRRRRRLGSQKEGAFSGEGGGLGSKKEVVGIGEGSVLIGEGEGWDRRWTGPSSEKEASSIDPSFVVSEEEAGSMSNFLGSKNEEAGMKGGCPSSVNRHGSSARSGCAETFREVRVGR